MADTKDAGLRFHCPYCPLDEPPFWTEDPLELREHVEACAQRADESVREIKCICVEHRNLQQDHGVARYQRAQTFHFLLKDRYALKFIPHAHWAIVWVAPRYRSNSETKMATSAARQQKSAVAPSNAQTEQDNEQ